MGLKHIHLLVRAEVYTPQIEEEELRNWFSELVRKVGMQELIPPVAKFCDDPNNLGCTGMVGITTSHASVHIWDVEKFLMMDLYSCKGFDHRTVLEHIHERFSVTGAKYLLIDRDDATILEEGIAAPHESQPGRIFLSSVYCPHGVSLNNI